MNTLAWTLQVVCATAFLTSGTMTSLMSKERMIATQRRGDAPRALRFETVRACSLTPGTAVRSTMLPAAWTSVS
jgi:hypothetical protein